MQNETSAQPHSVAIVGGAVSGAEVAGRLADRGVNVAVFEQNPRPFGKIEDGLPRWHHKLRDKEYLSVSDKLSHPNIQFVPNTVIGKDIDFAALCNDWGFSAVVLANGAWRDRPLAIEGADACVGKGLIYQNPLVTWWNHLEEQGSDPNAFEIQDDTIVLGGGLASIDVAKIVMLEITRGKLLERGIDIDVITLEVKGIPKILAGYGLAFEDLGLKGCTIFYRRRLEDMPVVTIPEDATPERAAKARKSRGTLLDKAMRKYCFTVQELSVADSLIMDGDKLAGIVFRKTDLVDGRVVTTDETFERRGSCVISSIGSIPEPISGITMTGELYDFADWDTGRLNDYPTVFSVGNVVTGKGNIVASRKHAEHVTTDAIEAFLGVADDDSSNTSDTLEAVAAAQTASYVAKRLDNEQAPSAEARQATVDRISARQAAVQYPGSLDAWLKSVTPPPR